MCNVQSLMNATLCVSSPQVFFFTLYHKHQCSTSAALVDRRVVSCEPQSRTLAEQLLPCLSCPANHLSTLPLVASQSPVHPASRVQPITCPPCLSCPANHLSTLPLVSSQSPVHNSSLLLHLRTTTCISTSCQLWPDPHFRFGNWGTT